MSKYQKIYLNLLILFINKKLILFISNKSVNIERLSTPWKIITKIICYTCLIRYRPFEDSYHVMTWNNMYPTTNRMNRAKFKYFSRRKATFSISIPIPEQANIIHLIFNVISSQLISTYHLIQLSKAKLLDLFYTTNETSNTVVECTSHWTWSKRGVKHYF